MGLKHAWPIHLSHAALILKHVKKIEVVFRFGTGGRGCGEELVQVDAEWCRCVRVWEEARWAGRALCYLEHFITSTSTIVEYHTTSVQSIAPFGLQLWLATRGTVDMHTVHLCITSKYSCCLQSARAEQHMKLSKAKKNPRQAKKKNELDKRAGCVF